VLRDDDAAQDAAQEAILRAWRHGAGCRTADRPEAWLRTIARREALRLTRLAVPPLEWDDESAPEPGEAVEEVIAVRVDVERALGRLTERERAVVEHYYWHDLSCPEIAERLELPLGTVKIRLHRARHKLREPLA
jgi:RNA polymerase sigma-70 factor, ECF subfamily